MVQKFNMNDVVPNQPKYRFLPMVEIRISIDCISTENWSTSVMSDSLQAKIFFPVKIDYSERFEQNESHFVYKRMKCTVFGRVLHF